MFSQLASRGDQAHRMDQFSGRQKLTTCRPKQWSVTPPIDRQLDRPPSTVGGYRQSSDNWQTLSRARGPTRNEAKDCRLLYDLLIAAIVTRTDRKYEFITDHVTAMMAERRIDYETFALFTARSLLPMFALVNLPWWLDVASPQQRREIEKIWVGIIVEITSLISQTY